MRFLTILLMGVRWNVADVPSAAKHFWLHRDSKAGTHRRADRHRLDEMALHAGRLVRQDVIDERLNVLGQLRAIEAELADDGVDDPGGVVAGLDLARLDRKSTR